MYAINLLETLAKEKIKTLRFIDEIEFYLDYPIQFKEELELPIDVTQMLYPEMSSLSAQDLRQAKSYVKAHLENKDYCYKFLIHHDSWIECLKENKPYSFQALLEARNPDVDLHESAYVKLQKRYEKELTELTHQLLNEHTKSKSHII